MCLRFADVAVSAFRAERVGQAVLVAGAAAMAMLEAGVDAREDRSTSLEPYAWMDTSAAASGWTGSRQRCNSSHLRTGT